MIAKEFKYNGLNGNIIEPTGKLGVMLVGLAGNNGSTFAASLLAKNHDISWQTKDGNKRVDFLGSLYQYGTMDTSAGPQLYRDVVPLRTPKQLVVGGWDITGENLYESCKKNKVLPPNLCRKLRSHLREITPLPSIYDPDFVATNQQTRCVTHKTSKSKWQNIYSIQSDIAGFRVMNELQKVIVVWTASTERLHTGQWKTADELLRAVTNRDPEISPSLQFAIAAVMSGCIFVNGSPQNTIGTALLQLATRHGGFAVGEDFKTGQTKLKSVLVDFLSSSGIRPLSIVSYNHLGNNDGLNLAEQKQFESKENSKRNVISDVVASNPALFQRRTPEHVVVIKYVAAVGDSKRAMDEYYSELMLDGRSTIALHNTCEDTLLAVPVMLDIILFGDFLSRIEINRSKLKSDLSLLSFFFKAPVGDNVQNAFFTQLTALRNFFRICAGQSIPDCIDLPSRLEKLSYV